MHIKSPSGLILMLLALAAPSLHAAPGDPRHGAELYAQECAECHSLQAGRNKKGPSLFAIGGRKVATVEGFDYSAALRQRSFEWTAEQLDAYLSNPRKHVPGGSMKYEGLDDPADRADLIAHLLSVR